MVKTTPLSSTAHNHFVHVDNIVPALNTAHEVQITDSLLTVLLKYQLKDYALNPQGHDFAKVLTELRDKHPRAANTFYTKDQLTALRNLANKATDKRYQSGYNKQANVQWEAPEVNFSNNTTKDTEPILAIVVNLPSVKRCNLLNPTVLTKPLTKSRLTSKAPTQLPLPTSRRRCKEGNLQLYADVPSHVQKTKRTVCIVSPMECQVNIAGASMRTGSAGAVQSTPANAPRGFKMK